ncbi:MAG: aa3-type cytochrome c oxidase subunit IV [Hyphomonadaceae bacterium]
MAQSGAHGNMEIQDQKDTFHGFLMATIWGCGLIAQLVALLTLGMAIGAGWFAGLAAFVVIGIAVGLAFRLSGIYWATQVTLWVLLGLGGLIVPALSGMMS